MLQTFTALAEPNRLRIVELLRSGPQPVGAIGARLQLYQPQVSKHLRVLRDAGLVDVHPRAQQRLYALRSEPLRDLDKWLEHFRALWDERLSNLERYLVATQAQEGVDTATSPPAPAHDTPGQARPGGTQASEASLSTSADELLVSHRATVPQRVLPQSC